jgi:CcmD family protein
MQPIYVVLIINLIIWSGIFGYMLKIDREILQIKRKLEKTEETKIR